MELAFEERLSLFCNLIWSEIRAWVLDSKLCFVREKFLSIAKKLSLRAEIVGAKACICSTGVCLNMRTTLLMFWASSGIYVVCKKPPAASNVCHSALIEFKAFALETCALKF